MGPRPGEGTLIYADATHLHGPIGLVFAPNGDLITANSDAVNADPAQPSELVEFTTGGQFVGQFSVDPANGGAFGLAVSTTFSSTLNLNQGDLNEVTAGTLQIGSTADTGGITVDSAITAPAGWSTLDLENGGEITDNGTAANTITVGSLAVRSGGGVNLDTAVTDLAFSNTSTAVAIRNTGALTITTVDGLTTSTNTGSTTTLTATSPMTFAVNTTSAGTITAMTTNG